MSDTPRFADIPAVPYIFVRRKLPAGGVDELLDIPHTPLVNVAMGLLRSRSAIEGLFPLQNICLLASNKSFLKLLGDPVAVGEDMESEPGIWWLSTADNQHHVIIYSDSHKEDAWKGGQVCVSTNANGNASGLSIPVLALSKTCEAMFGNQVEFDPDKTSLTDFFGENSLIHQLITANPSLAWPQWSNDLPAQDLTLLAKSARASLVDLPPRPASPAP